MKIGSFNYIDFLLDDLNNFERFQRLGELLAPIQKCIKDTEHWFEKTYINLKEYDSEW